jgi:hypothetical protein
MRISHFTKAGMERSDAHKAAQAVENFNRRTVRWHPATKRERLIEALENLGCEVIPEPSSDGDSEGVDLAVYFEGEEVGKVAV